MAGLDITRHLEGKLGLSFYGYFAVDAVRQFVDTEKGMPEDDEGEWFIKYSADMRENRYVNTPRDALKWKESYEVSGTRRFSAGKPIVSRL